MKTEETIKAAIATYEKELKTIQDKIDAITTWKDASNYIQHADLFIAQRKELDELRSCEKEMDFKIRFAKWVLN